MGFVTGEVESREQAPWAYDADNDLLKQGPLYMAAAGLSGFIAFSVNPLAAGGFAAPDGGSAVYTVPAGKKALVTDLRASAHAGKVQVNLKIAGAGIGILLITPGGGGSISDQFVSPVVATAGQTISFEVYNIDTANPAPDFNARANFVVL